MSWLGLLRLKIKGINMVRKILAMLFGIFFTVSVFATDDPYGPALPQVWSSIITVSGGPAWANPGKDQYLYPYPPPMYNHYIADHDWGILGTGELFFGLQHFIGATNLIGQFGIGFAGASDASVSGVVNVNGIPDVYTYSYQVSHVRAELKGKLITNGFQPVQPYFSASLGVGFNHSHDYIPTTIDPILYPTYWFSTVSTPALSYTLGLGVQKMLSPNWQVGIGYEFADWGQSHLGEDDVTLLQGPMLPHLYTNELLFSLSYMY